MSGTASLALAGVEYRWSLDGRSDKLNRRVKRKPALRGRNRAEG